MFSTGTVTGRCAISRTDFFANQTQGGLGVRHALMLVKDGLGSGYIPLIGIGAKCILLFGFKDFITFVVRKVDPLFTPSLTIESGKGSFVGLLFPPQNITFVLPSVAVGKNGAIGIGGSGKAAAVGEVEGFRFGFAAEELFEERFAHDEK